VDSRCTGKCSNVVIYNLYLPKLLTQFGFPQGLVTALLIIEAVLAVVMEPLFGGLSDQASGGSAVSFAVGSASICFVHCNSCYLRQSSWDALAATKGDASMGFSHDNFRSPALSLLGRYASATNLP